MTDQKHTKERDDETKLLEALDAMAETWMEKNGIAQAISTIPVNCPTSEFKERAYNLITRHVKQAYVEGLYCGRNSSLVELANLRRERDELREALNKLNALCYAKHLGEGASDLFIKIEKLLTKIKGDV